MELNDVVADLRGDLEHVETRLRNAADIDYPLVGEFLDKIITAGGKRLRPLLLLLASKPFNYDLDILIPAAAGVEMLHTASLIHDDTIDHAFLRRGQPTLNTSFNAETVILLGDYLFAQSAILATETMNPRVVHVFATSLSHICDGQLREIFHGGSLDQSREDYERRIFGKTASLFAAAAEMGAILGGANEDQILQLREFGVDVGMAFQIVDDVLDFRSTEGFVGKPVGSDLRQGTVTLPTMLFLQNSNGNSSATLVRKIVDGDPVPDAEINAVTTLISESGAIEEALLAANVYVERAVARLEVLANPLAAAKLEIFAESALHRQS